MPARDGRRTIARAVAPGRRTRRCDARLPRQGRRGLARGLVERAAERVDALANGLLALGIRKGDTLAILGSTTLEWALFDYAAACVGAITAAIYANSSQKDCRYILEHSEAIGVLVEDDEQASKLDGGPQLRHVITFAGLDELAEQGRAYAAEHPGALDAAVETIREDDVFTYIYTSGTTGSPKACMISHLNYYAMVAVADDLHDFTVEGDLMLLFLPLAHNFGRLMHLSGPYIGFTIAFCPDPLEVGDALPRREADRLPERAPRLREDPHAGPDAVRRGHGSQTATGRLVARRRPPGERAEGRAPPDPGLARRTAPACVPARLLEGPGAPRWEAARRHLRRRAPREGGRRVLPRARHPDPRGLRPHRVHLGRNGEPDRRLPLRHRRPGPSRHGAPPRRGRRAHDPQRDGLPGLLQRPRGDERSTRRGRLAPLRRRRRDRRRRLRHDHRPEEGHPDHGRRKERRAGEPREPAQELAVCLARRRDRRPAPVRHAR